MKPLVFLVFALALSACNPTHFSAVKKDDVAGPGITPSNPGPGQCLPNSVESIRRMTKLLFLVDTSGSNADTTYNSCGVFGGVCADPATDPTKQFRAGAISGFLQNYRHKTNFQWGFVTFARDSARALLNFNDVTRPAFAANPNLMQSALNVFLATADDGNTPYHAALEMAKRAISADPDLRTPAKPDYFVILLTDGFPTDYVDSRGQFNAGMMESDVRALVNLAPDQVSLSTIYYSHVPDDGARQLLRRMADLGAGQAAAVTPTGVDFKIDDVIPGSRQDCQ